MAANDGASGVAVMLEVARKLEELKPELGIDFICFDSEDYGMPYWADTDDVADGSDWCLGSQYWAAHPHVPGYKARFGILLDMVGGRDARLSCIFQGSTDTTFYVLAVYFGSVGIRDTRHAVTCGLLADLAGIIAAIAIAYMFFG